MKIRYVFSNRNGVIPENLRLHQPPVWQPPISQISGSRFFLIKPTDALISQIYFCQRNLHVSGSSSAYHHEFSTVHSAMVYIMQVWWQLSSTNILVVFESCHQTCMTYTSAECTVENSWWWAEELLETCRFSWQRYIWEISASVGFIKKKFATMHGNMNVKIVFSKWDSETVRRISVKHEAICTVQSLLFSILVPWRDKSSISMRLSVSQ